MKIPYFCCIGAELKRYAQDFDFMNQVYLYKVPTDDTIEEVLAEDYFKAISNSVLQDDIVYIYEASAKTLHTCRFNKQNGHITAEQIANNAPGLTPNRVLISDATGRITAGDVTLEYLKNKVNLDGSSTMTGPLKFRAGSFSGAIAGGLGDGVSIYKIKANGTIDSEVASLTKTNGFTPGTTNAQNIGSSNLKWKDAHIVRVITAVLNNGYDIAVPVTNSVDSFALESEITDINSKIPAQASSSNQLADKNFVNSSIATNTANFIGTFNSVADLEAYSGTVTNNDYAFVIGTDSAGNTTYNRYKYNTNTQQWIYEYTLNNSSFTAAQWATINSGGTAADVAKARSAIQPSDLGNGTITITQGGTTKGTFTTNQGNNTTIDIDAGGGGSGLNVGDIFLTMRNDNELNGAVECDGSTYNTTDFTGAQSIGQLLADGKVPYVSMAVYASTVAAQGWCDKFGWDGTGNTQFKVPTLSAYIWQKLQTGVAGTGKTLGLVCGQYELGLGGFQTGLWPTFFETRGTDTGSSASGKNYNAGDKTLGITTDATKSGIIAGSASDISQQRCMVQLATSATDEALETCTGVLADVAALKYDYVVDFQAPTAQNNYTWYRKYKSGWVEQGGIVLDSEAGSYNVVLPVTMSDTNYTIMLSGKYDGNGTEFTYSNVSTTGFERISQNGGGTIAGRETKWTVSGMAAN